MVARRLGALALVALCAAGCEPEPSIAPSVLESAKQEIATLQADLEKAEEERKVERERVKALLQEVRAARELISGSESDAIERQHYEQVLLRRASAEVDQLLLGSPLQKTLAADRSADGARALEALGAIPARPFKTLVDLHKAQAALLETIPVLLQSAKGAGKDQARVRAQHLRDIDELRMRLTRSEDEMLRMARDFDRARRRAQLARQSLEKIAAEGDATSKAEAQGSRPRSRRSDPLALVDLTPEADAAPVGELAAGQAPGVAVAEVAALEEVEGDLAAEGLLVGGVADPEHVGVLAPALWPLAAEGVGPQDRVVAVDRAQDERPLGTWREEGLLLVVDLPADAGGREGQADSGLTEEVAELEEALEGLVVVVDPLAAVAARGEGAEAIQDAHRLSSRERGSGRKGGRRSTSGSSVTKLAPKA